MIFKNSRQYGAVLTPRGCHVVQHDGRRGNPALLRYASDRAAYRDAGEAGDKLADLVEAQGGRGGHVSLAISGFGSCHHVVTLPPAEAEVLRPVVEREIRRIHPDLPDAVVDFVPLPSGPEHRRQEQDLQVGAVPKSVIRQLQRSLESRGITLERLTLVPQALQAVHAAAEPSPDPMAALFLLPEAPLLGFLYDGRIRLYAEPPAAAGTDDRALAALAEQVDRGILFLRQHFRGARVTRLMLAAEPRQFPSLRAGLADRLDVDVVPYPGEPVAPGAAVSLGAALDAADADGINLLPEGERPLSRSERLTRLIGTAAAIILVLAGLWWAWTGVRSAEAAEARIAALEERLQQREPALRQIRRVVDERQAHAARMVVLTPDPGRIRLQEVLWALESPASGIDISTVALVREGEEWVGSASGTAHAATSADATRAVEDLYRRLVRTLPPNAVELLRMGHGDPSEGAGPQSAVAMRFELRLIVPIVEAGES